MKNLKNKCVILGVIFLLCLSCLISFVHLEINYIDPDFKEEILPKLNNQNINITTPENKTYTELMSGYYPSTYGFENDKNGNVPVGWTDYSHDGCGTKVISELDGHKKVIELWDKNNSGYSKIYNNFLPQTSGTIEWWWRQSSGGVASHVIIGDGPTLRWSIYNQLQYDDLSGTSHTIILVNTSQWYHHKIVFNCSNNSFDWYIDGVLQADNAKFRYKRSALSFFRLNTWYSHRDYSFYIDAVGYSWDSNYNIGNNIEEGLFLNFISNVELNWIGYKLDTQDKITIMGNTTIPLPDCGTHSIQVFGSDSVGINYLSDIRIFTIGDVKAPTIIINSPVSNDLFGETAPHYTVTITDNVGVNTMWYDLNRGTDFLFEDNGTFSSTEWGNMPNGTVTITFYANDNASNVASKSIIVRKDIEAPTIVINSPISNDLFGETTPHYTVAITDSSGVNTMWYTLNGGENNIFISNGTIDATEWSELENGDVIITFYARDNADNMASKSVTVKKGYVSPLPILIIVAIIASLSVGIIIAAMIMHRRPPKKRQIIPEKPREIFPPKATPDEVQKVEITTSFCPMCGTKISDKEKFCSNCGTEL